VNFPGSCRAADVLAVVNSRYLDAPAMTDSTAGEGAFITSGDLAAFICR
jgi:hypothetical protein